MLLAKTLDQMVAKAQGNRTEQRAGNILVVPSTATTMDLAREARAMGAGHGYTVIACEQSAGIGSADPATGERRVWTSPPGNLYLSMLVEIDKMRGEHGEQVATVAGLAAGLAAQNSALYHKEGASIQDMALTWHWPNDLWHTDAKGHPQKLAGVLVPTEPEKENTVILGVGVNIATIPPATALREGSEVAGATSLHALGSTVSVGQFAAAFLMHFDRQLRMMRHYGYGAILDEMGFSRRGQLQLSMRGTSFSITGRYNGYRTAPSPEGILTDYLMVVHRGGESRFGIRELAGTAPIPR